MLPKYHLYLGILFAGIIYFIFPSIGLIGGGIILASSVLVDVDHYITYVIRKKDLSLKKAFEWFYGFRKLREKTKERLVSPIVVFHTLEILILIGVIAIFNELILFVFVGFVFHSICDIAEMSYKGELFYAREFFLMRYIIDYKNPKYL